MSLLSGELMKETSFPYAEAWGYVLGSFHVLDHFSPHVGSPDMSASFEVTEHPQINRLPMPARPAGSEVSPATMRRRSQTLKSFYA